MEEAKGYFNEYVWCPDWFINENSNFIIPEYRINLLNKTILVLTPSIIDAIWYSLVTILVTGYGLKEILNKNMGAGYHYVLTDVIN